LISSSLLYNSYEIHLYLFFCNSVLILTRNPKNFYNSAKIIIKKCNGSTLGDWCSAIEGADVIINLSGTFIAEGRWTGSRKTELLESRIQSTKILIQAISSMSSRPHTFINASVVGFYGHTKDTIVNENSPRGKGYLSDLCVQWEEEVRAVKKSVSRVIILRMGVIL
jgi:NAD dependent epimerase/dehydratase family enzyme